MSTEVFSAGPPPSGLVYDAFREGNLIAIGEVPTTLEQGEGLGLLNKFINGIYGYELGENLFPWTVPGTIRTAPVAANYPQLPYPTDLPGMWPIAGADGQPEFMWPYPPQNSRIIYGNVSMSPLTIWFPWEPDDGARMEIVSNATANPAAVLTVQSNGRGFMVDSEPVVSIELTPPIKPQRWFYRADLACWVPISNLTLAGVSPFPQEFDNLLITAVNFRLSPRYGVEPRAGSANEMTQSLKRLKTRYRQSGTTIFGSQDFPRSLQSYIAGQWWW